MDICDILNALSHQSRLEFLTWMKNPHQHFEFIDEEERLEGISAGRFQLSGLSQSAVSSHLAVLYRAKLVSTRRAGQRILYRRNEDTIRTFLDEITELI